MILDLHRQGLSPTAIARQLGIAQIREVITANIGEAIEVHALRTRHAGKATFIDFHLVVPAKMGVESAHEICDRIEAALREAVAGATATIHVEPEGKACA